MDRSIYLYQISHLKNKKLTLREIDAIACLLSGKGIKTLSSFLNVEQKTFESHWQNIKKKLEVFSKEALIDLIENEKKREYFLKHYQILHFEKIFRENTIQLPDSKIIDVHFDNSKDYLKLFSELIKRHFGFLNIKLKMIPSIDNSFDHIVIESKLLKSEYDFSTDVMYKNPKEYFLSLNDLLKIFDPTLPIDNKKLESLLITQVIDKSLDMPIIDPKQKESKSKKLYFFSSLIVVLCGFVFFSFFKIQKLMSYSEPDIRVDMPFGISCDERKSLLSKMDGFLNKENQISHLLLLGLPGSGKTFLAKTFAKKQKNSISFEIDARSLESCEQSYFKLASLLAISNEERDEIFFIKQIEERNLKIQHLLTFLQKKIRNKKGWILIFDKVINFDEIEIFIPKDETLWGDGNVILTSIDCTLIQKFDRDKSIFVDELVEEEALQLFLKLCNRFSKEEVKAFLKKIPLFPLDVVLAANTIFENNISLSEYISRIEMPKNNEIYQKRDVILSQSLMEFMKINPKYKQVLFIISLCDYKSIPKRFLYLYYAHDFIDEFIKNLKKHSFIVESSYIDDECFFSFHPVVHDFLLDFIKKNENKEQLKEVLKKFIYSICDFFEKRKTSFRTLEIFSFHIDCLIKKINTFDTVDKKIDFYANYMAGLAHYFCSRKLHLSKKYFECAQSLNKEMGFLSLNQERNLHLILSYLYTDLGEISSALQSIEIGLSKVNEKDFCQKAEFISQKGYAESFYNQFDLSEKDFINALNILNNVNADEKSDGLKSMIMGQRAILYASTYLAKEEAKISLKYIEDAFSSINFDMNFKKGLPRFVCYHFATLGCIYCYMGDYVSAMEKGFNKAMHIVENKLDGCEHLIIKNFVNAGIGECLLRKGKIKEAETILKEAVQKNYLLRGSHFIPNFRAQTLLMESYLRLNIIDKAEEEFLKLKTFDVKNATHNILFMECLLYYNGAFLYLKKGELTKSKECYLIFFERMKTFIASFDPELSLKLENDLYFKNLVCSESNLMDCYTKALKLLTKIYPDINFSYY